jgi:hypothetical protein
MGWATTPTSGLQFRREYSGSEQDFVPYMRHTAEFETFFEGNCWAKLLGVPGDLISQPRIVSRWIGYLGWPDLFLLNVEKIHLPAAKK